MKNAHELNTPLEIAVRLRRNRRKSAIRDGLAETSLSAANLVYPLFIEDGSQKATPIPSLVGQSRWTVDLLIEELKSCEQLGLQQIALFPKIDDKLKNAKCREALNEDNYYLHAIHKIKSVFPKMVIYSDVALDPYSSDGHDGLVEHGRVLNDETVEILVEQSLLQAQAGSDYISPSDMMDGRVGAIRRHLDDNGFSDTGIMAYAAKYASNFYGPFREALDSAPKSKGDAPKDKKSYQMDYRNSKEALREVELDVMEGADIVMVKPALCYLDIIREIKNNFHIPVAAYNVSGEYAMLKGLMKAGLIDPEQGLHEVLYSMKRAGSDLIFTYFAKDFAQFLNKHSSTGPSRN